MKFFKILLQVVNYFPNPTQIPALKINTNMLLVCGALFFITANFTIINACKQQLVTRYLSINKPLTVRAIDG